MKDRLTDAELDEAMSVAKSLWSMRLVSACAELREARKLIREMHGLLDTACDVLSGAEEGEAEYEGVLCRHYADRIREALAELVAKNGGKP